MRDILTLALAAGFSCGAFAQSDKDHAAHHPPQGAASAAVSAAARAPSPAQMDMQMKTMQDMHEKMLAAKTPEERQALMADHMKTMQDGMAMMGRMHGGKSAKPGAGMGGGMSMNSDSMGKRMDMMEMMMQMMMDREAARPPAGK